jgi:hypothetical protein
MHEGRTFKLCGSFEIKVTQEPNIPLDSIDKEMKRMADPLKNRVVEQQTILCHVTHQQLIKEIHTSQLTKAKTAAHRLSDSFFTAGLTLC